MIVSHGLGRDSVDEQHGNIVSYGYCILPIVVPIPDKPISYIHSFSDVDIILKAKKIKDIEDEEEVALIFGLF